MIPVEPAEKLKAFIVQNIALIAVLISIAAMLRWPLWSLAAAFYAIWVDIIIIFLCVQWMRGAFDKEDGEGNG